MSFFSELFDKKGDFGKKSKVSKEAKIKMFLKKVRPNKRILFNKHFIDPRATILIKKKLRNRTTQRFLQFFARYVVAYSSVRFDRPGWRRYNRYKKVRTRSSVGKRRRGRRSVRKKPYTRRRALQRANTSTANKPRRKFTLSCQESSPVKRFILSRMRFYNIYKGATQNSLMSA